MDLWRSAFTVLPVTEANAVKMLIATALLIIGLGLFYLWSATSREGLTSGENSIRLLPVDTTQAVDSPAKRSRVMAENARGRRVPSRYDS
jgi:hypothetical protein